MDQMKTGVTVAAGLWVAGTVDLRVAGTAGLWVAGTVDLLVAAPTDLRMVV